MYKQILKNQKIYNKQFGKIIKNKKKFIYEPFYDIILNIIKKNKYKFILDYGCGDGRLGYFIKKKKIFITGVDISKESVKICSKFYDKTYLNNGVNLPKCKFDFIVFNSVLEHLPRKILPIFLKKVSIKMKSGNGIFIQIPNFNSPSRIFTSRWNHEVDELGHIKFISLSFLKKKLKSLGFVCLQSSFNYKIKKLPDYVLIPPLLKQIVKILYRLLSIYPFYYLKDSLLLYAIKK
jgi:SAM-dependent methyltransferase